MCSKSSYSSYTAKHLLYYTVCESMVTVILSHGTDLKVVNKSSILLITKRCLLYGGGSKLRLLAMTEESGLSVAGTD